MVLLLAPSLPRETTRFRIYRFISLYLSFVIFGAACIYGVDGGEHNWHHLAVAAGTVIFVAFAMMTMVNVLAKKYNRLKAGEKN